MTFANDQFIAVGPGGSITASGDGLQWTNRVSGFSANLFAITYGPDQFVAVGQQTIAFSTNGKTWSRRIVGTTNDFLAIAFGKDTFVAAGSAGAIWTSWTLLIGYPAHRGQTR